MTLQRQLMITILVLFALMFAGTFAITTYVNRSYLDKQLRTHARDAATSLGLILSQQAPSNDLATMTSMIDAVFDRGYYHKINLVDTDNNSLISRQATVRVDQVPEWFVDFIHFKMPTESALVMSGWHHYGKVNVSSHPGFAYQELWANTTITLGYFCLVALFALLLGAIAIRALLKPLRAMAAQAMKIAEGHFVIQEKLPRTVQLRKVAETMNYMAKKLERMFDEQRKVTNQLRRRVYQDSVTGLDNHQHLINHLQHSVTMAAKALKSTFIMVDIDGMNDYNRIHGVIMGDELMRRFSEVVKAKASTIPNAYLARSIGARFAIVVPISTDQFLLDFVRDLADDIAIVANNASDDSVQVTTYVGAELVTAGMTPAEILAATDVALNSARLKGHYSYDVKALSADEIKPEIQWREIIQNIIDNHSYQLLVQPGYNREREILFHEVLIRGVDTEGNLHYSRELFAMAERLGMASQLDKLICQRAIALLASKRFVNHGLVLNLSSSSLNDSDFIAWLKSELAAQKNLAKHLIFEISEFNAVHNMDVVKALIDDFSQLGAGIALDKFGQAASNFSYLQSVKLNYLKLAGNFVRDIDINEDNQFYVQSLVRVAHSIDIPVIADKVETEYELEVLLNLNIDGAQGNVLAEPSVVE